MLNYSESNVDGEGRVMRIGRPWPPGTVPDLYDVDFVVWTLSADAVKPYLDDGDCGYSAETLDAITELAAKFLSDHFEASEDVAEMTRDAVLAAVEAAAEQVRAEAEAREINASLPLGTRQEAARKMGYPDGLPLAEGDYRRVIRWARRSGTLSRAQTLVALSPPDDPTERRLGSLGPGEFGVLFEQEWPGGRDQEEAVQ